MNFFKPSIKDKVKTFQKNALRLETAVAGRFGRGSIAIQNDSILTADELEAERDELIRWLDKRTR